MQDPLKQAWNELNYFMELIPDEHTKDPLEILLEEEAIQRHETVDEDDGQ